MLDELEQLLLKQSQAIDKNMSDETMALGPHGYKPAELTLKKGTIVSDGEISGEAAERLFREYCMKCGMTTEEERRSTRVALAASLSYGTSAETDLSKRYLDSDDPETSLAYLADVLTAEGSPLAMRTNFLRVFAKSLPFFADLTRAVIKGNQWLAEIRALDYEVDVSMAGVCFDYSDKLTVSTLTPTERNLITYGLRKKAREGRAMIAAPEGTGVHGSDPVSRGVASNIVPDAGRVGSNGGRGVGPYA